MHESLRAQMSVTLELFFFFFKQPLTDDAFSLARCDVHMKNHFECHQHARLPTYPKFTNPKSQIILEVDEKNKRMWKKIA